MRSASLGPSFRLLEQCVAQFQMTSLVKQLKDCSKKQAALRCLESETAGDLPRYSDNDPNADLTDKTKNKAQVNIPQIKLPQNVHYLKIFSFHLYVEFC